MKRRADIFINIISVAISLLLFVSIKKHQHDYYSFLRIAVMFGCLMIIIYRVFVNEKPLSLILFGAIAYLFNPIFPVHIYRRHTWVMIDLFVGFIFLVKPILDTSRNKAVKKVSAKLARNPIIKYLFYYILYPNGEGEEITLEGRFIAILMYLFILAIIIMFIAMIFFKWIPPPRDPLDQYN